MHEPVAEAVLHSDAATGLGDILRAGCSDLRRTFDGWVASTPKPYRDFATFFVLQGFQYLIVVVNTRAFTHLQYGMTAATDFVFCWLSWTLWKKISEAEGWAAKSGYMLGGTCGSLLGMYLTRVWG